MYTQSLFRGWPQIVSKVSHSTSDTLIDKNKHPNTCRFRLDMTKYSFRVIHNSLRVYTMTKKYITYSPAIVEASRCVNSLIHATICFFKFFYWYFIENSLLITLHLNCCLISWGLFDFRFRFITHVPSVLKNVWEIWQSIIVKKKVFETLNFTFPKKRKNNENILY